MKNITIVLFLLHAAFLKSQVFNDFYIKQQIDFYEEDDDAFRALDTLKGFLLNSNKNEFIYDCSNEYCSELLKLLFSTNLPQQFYYFVPTIYYKKDNYIVFEVDIIESVEIEDTLENAVFANVLIPVNLEDHKIVLNQENVNLLPNIYQYSFNKIKIISNKNDYKKFKEQSKKIQAYIKNISKKLSIPSNLLDKNPLTILSSSTLNDGYFYYGINKYLGYVNNYNNNKIFAGSNPIFYEHEIIHYLLKMKTSTEINQIVNEGIATWLGGSLNLTYPEYLTFKTRTMNDENLKTMIHDFLSDTEALDDSSYDYWIRAIFVCAILDENGINKKIDDKKLDILLSERLSKASISKMIEVLNLDTDNLKYKMLHEIQKYRKN